MSAWIYNVFCNRFDWDIRTISRHFGSYKPGELRKIWHKGLISAVKSSQLSWAGQYKKCVQYDFKFTLEYSAVKSSQLSWAGQYKKCVQYGFKFTPVYT